MTSHLFIRSSYLDSITTVHYLIYTLHLQTMTTVHATIPERSYAERAASTASAVEHGNKLACNPRSHVITQRVLAQQKIV